MTIRTRKLVGTIILLVFITVYCLLAMALAVSVLPNASAAGQLVFYAVAGLLWVIPAGLLVSWMGKPD
jgi:hypothetical protein